jgi:hypothetical protein
MTDSAGTPWAGRHFEHNASSDDDGSAPAALTDALGAFRAGEAGEAAVVDAVRESRLLVPLVARLDEVGVSDHGHAMDKSAELAIVTVTGPDGRNVLPAFSSVDAMRRWDPEARPVPADAVRVALAAASENTDLVVLDPGSETEFVIRRPALWAIGQSKSWTPSYLDDEVIAAFGPVIDPRVVAVTIAQGDPHGLLAGPELLVQLALVPGLDRAELDGLLAELRARWAADEIIAARVDSLGVALVAAP